MDRLILGPFSSAQQSEILFTRGIPENVLPERLSRERTAILYSPGAEPIANQVAEAIQTINLRQLADREDAKTLEESVRIYEWLSERNIGRHDTIIGVGGGAATDKNLVGAFHLPSRVIIDLEILEALPEPLRQEGIAEALKAGYVGDSRLVDLLQGTDPPLAELVKRAVAVKVEVVGSDFRDNDRRAVLNFGHTIGHAVELLAPMPHGLAVAVGMVAAGTISAIRYGFDSRGLVETVFGLGLPVAAAGVTPGPALDLIRKDKKRSSQGTRMVLLRQIADPVVEPVPENLIELGLAAIGIA
ncbi:MAG: hypothetical protein LC739_00570 [Actinobacteria bacterium]|nr:hypothetical protein [Actinomycetota bacterium]